MMHHSLKIYLASLFSFFAIALVGANPSWKDKPIQQWTEQDAKQVLANSPWVKWATVKAYIPQSEDQLRAGGKMGGGQGVGLQGLDPKGFLIGSSPKRNRNPAIPVNVLQVRWESAAPVHAAELKLPGAAAPDDWKGDYYAVAVYGVPIPPDELSEESNNWNLKKLAFLKRQGHKDVKPIKIDISAQTDKLSIVVYFFPRSADITDSVEHVEFDARIGRIMLNQVFDTAEMRFGDKLEL